MGRIEQKVIDQTLTIEMQRARDEQLSDETRAQGEAREETVTDIWWRLRGRGIGLDAPMTTEDLPRDREPRAGGKWFNDKVDEIDEKRQDWLK
jgi:hypothetical protein